MSYRVNALDVVVDHLASRLPLWDPSTITIARLAVCTKENQKTHGQFLKTWLESKEATRSLLLDRVTAETTAAALENCANPSAVTFHGCTALHRAVGADVIDSVQLLVRAGADVDAADVRGLTPLHLACIDGSDDIVSWLLAEARADPDVADDLYQTPLMSALQPVPGSNLGNVFRLLEHNASVTTSDTDGITALHIAVCHDNAHLLQTLLDRGADPHARDDFGRSPLHTATMMGMQTSMTTLLNAGADLEMQCKRGYTPLLYACEKDDLDAVGLLLGAGASPVATTFENYTALHMAAANDSAALVTVMVDAGTPVNATCCYGRTPHSLAVLYNFSSAGYVLEVAGAIQVPVGPCVPRTEGLVMHAATVLGLVDAVVAFLDAGADVNIQNSTDDTPLHRAVEEGKMEVASVLLARGAYVNAQNDDGLTPLHIAVYDSKPAFVDLLLRHNAAANFPVCVGRTPLHIAAFWGDCATVALLLQYGAALETRDDFGETPLDRAMYHSATTTGALLRAAAQS